MKTHLATATIGQDRVRIWAERTNCLAWWRILIEYPYKGPDEFQFMSGSQREIANYLARSPSITDLEWNFWPVYTWFTGYSPDQHPAHFEEVKYWLTSLVRHPKRAIA